MNIQKLIQRRHPKYIGLVDHWNFLEQSYVGGREWFAKNIFRYVKEGDSDFSSRVERAYRFNHTREVVDLVSKYLFRTQPRRNEESAPESVIQFWNDSNRRGSEISSFARVIANKGSIYGRPWIVVDSDSKSESESQADEEGSSIYAYIVPPEDALDMAYDDHGDLIWILFREVYREDTDPFEDDEPVRARFRLWTRNEWFLFDVDNKNSSKKETKYLLKDSGEHGLGEVPVIKGDNIHSEEPYDCPALINDVAYLDRATANYASNLDQIIQDQTYSQLAMPAQNVLPGEDTYNKLVEMGTKRIFIYDGEGGQGPAYLSPDPKQAELIITAIKQLINEIYHSVGLAGERTKQDNSSGIDNSSGVAKDKDFDRVNSLLQAKSSSLQRIENEMVRLVCLWAGDKVPEDKLVEYPDSYNTRGLWDEFDIATRLAAIQIPALIRSEQMKEMVEKLFPSISSEKKKELIAAVEKWKDEAEESAEFAHKNMLEGGEEQQSNVLGEAKRNRESSGAIQSKTKSRQATGDKNNDQATGQGNS